MKPFGPLLHKSMFIAPAVSIPWQLGKMQNVIPHLRPAEWESALCTRFPCDGCVCWSCEAWLYMGLVAKDKTLRTAWQDRSEACAPEKGPQGKSSDNSLLSEMWYNLETRGKKTGSFRLITSISRYQRCPLVSYLYNFFFNQGYKSYPTWSRFLISLIIVPWEFLHIIIIVLV